jgi:chemotaxis protein CheC
MDASRLNELQLDALKATGNMGAHQALAALEQLTGKKVDINVSKALILEVEKIPEIMGGPETLITGIYLKILGDAKGDCLLLFKLEHALLLADMMLGKENGVSTDMDDEIEAALKELANILMGAYLTAISSFLELNIVSSVPYLASDMAGAVLDFVSADMSQSVGSALCLSTEFAIPPQKINGQFLMFFDAKSYDKILKSLGIYQEPATVE